MNWIKYAQDKHEQGNSKATVGALLEVVSEQQAQIRQLQEQVTSLLKAVPQADSRHEDDVCGCGRDKPEHMLLCVDCSHNGDWSNYPNRGKNKLFKTLR